MSLHKFWPVTTKFTKAGLSAVKKDMHIEDKNEEEGIRNV
jgi:hypothetical protein